MALYAIYADDVRDTGISANSLNFFRCANSTHSGHVHTKPQENTRALYDRVVVVDVVVRHCTKKHTHSTLNVSHTVTDAQISLCQHAAARYSDARCRDITTAVSYPQFS